MENHSSNQDDDEDDHTENIFDSHEFLDSCSNTKEEVMQVLEGLPRNLHWDREQRSQQQKNAANQEGGTGVSPLLETLAEDDDEELEDDDDDDNLDEEDKHEEGLKIAWQYRKDVQQERLGHTTSSSSAKKKSSATSSGNVYCHSYDLSGRLKDQMAAQQEQQQPQDDATGRTDTNTATSSVVMEDRAHICPIKCCDKPGSDSCRANHRSCGIRLFQLLFWELQKLQQQQPRKVIRLLLFHLPTESLSIALPLLLAQIRQQLLPVVVMVSVQSWKSNTAASSSRALLFLQRTSDAVFQLEGFAGRSVYPPPPEFRHLHGILLVRKVNTVTAATALGGGHYADLTMTKRPPANIYGLKRNRRKLTITLLHIPPEDHAEGGGSVGSGGVRSGAGRPATTASTAKASSAGGGCGSGNHNSSLDF